MTRKITANLRQQGSNVAIKYTYEYGRLKSIVYPNNPADIQGCTVMVDNSAEQCVGASNNVSYEYGPAGSPYNRAGRITKVTHQAGNEERYYGKLGEMVKEIDTLNFDPSQHFTAEIFVTRYHYDVHGSTSVARGRTPRATDSWGRMKQLTYPDGDKLIYHYDVGGQVNRITGEKGGVQQTYIDAIQYDEFEQRKQIKYGNGVETTYDYDPKNRYLQHLQSSGKQGTFQNLTYAFDKVGNIISRQNDVNPLNGIGGQSTQNYHYDVHGRTSVAGGRTPRATDSLYRLTQASGSYTQGDGDDRYSLNMRYDNIHNITNKAQVHARTSLEGVESLINGTSYTWDYDYESTQPHAANQIVSLPKSVPPITRDLLGEPHGPPGDR